MKSKKLHIIAPYPKGEAPSQRFRFEQYLGAYETAGFEIKHHSFHTTASWKRLYKSGKYLQKTLDLSFNFLRRWILLFQLIGAKHIFMHREMAHLGPPVFEFILAKLFRKKYVFDFDDAIWLPNYSSANARFQKLKCYWKTKHLIRWAHKVTAGNDYLANFALQFNANVQVIPTTIDTQNHHNLSTNHHSNPVVIGWTGTHSTMHYLDALIPIIRKLENQYSFVFHVISNQKPSYELSSMYYQDWQKDSEIHDLSKFHIGLMPLVNDKWSEGKCGFKALQYMALGSVPIASPVGVNTKIIADQENGLIAHDLLEWEKHLMQLLDNPALRQQLGKQAQLSIQQSWSVQAWEEKYVQLFRV